jgi:type I restriction enzyme S subunit
VVDGSLELVAKRSAPWPPTKEQEEIASSLDLALRRSDQVEHSIEHSIKFLGEYRSALITAAITGQIKELR